LSSSNRLMFCCSSSSYILILLVLLKCNRSHSFSDVSPILYSKQQAWVAIWKRKCGQRLIPLNVRHVPRHTSLRRWPFTECISRDRLFMNEEIVFDTYQRCLRLLERSVWAMKHSKCCNPSHIVANFVSTCESCKLLPQSRPMSVDVSPRRRG